MGTASNPRWMRKIGVEEELLLVDPNSGTPVAAAPAILCGYDSDDSPALEKELKQEQIEVISPPCPTLDELERQIRIGRSRADDAARKVGARAVALASSVLPVTPHVTSDARYLALEGKYGLPLRDELVCGFHVHVEARDDREGVIALNGVRRWLPVLLALSCNSPYWMGEDSGYESFRYLVMGRFPSFGAYDIFRDAAGYRGMVKRMVASNVILDEGMVYFDARLSHRFPTLEVRVCDVCLDADHAVALAGIIRALVDTVIEQETGGVWHAEISTVMVRFAMWSANKFGITGKLVDPLWGQPVDARQAVDMMLDFIRDALVHNGDASRVEMAIQGILQTGNGATFQREKMEQSADLSLVVREATSRSNQT